ncbi:MAG: DUF938 domain-containing protein [Pseudomonadota bacterium]
MSKRTPPPNASVAAPSSDGKLVAPAASRNAAVLSDLVARWAPPQGQAMEIASGTGQHVCAFAQKLPQLSWQPTEIDADRRQSIDAYASDQPNIQPAQHLDAATSGWHRQFRPKDLIVLINLLHLISWEETVTLVSETAKTLSSNCRFILYGPFMRDGKLTSDGDKRFHQALVQQDPEVGYKNDTDIERLLAVSGLNLIEVTEMPANNLAFVAQKQAE